MLLALVGLTAGQAVVWYTGQFYALFFLEKTLKVDGPLANILIATTLLLATPFFVFWSWLSDKVGPKPIMTFWPSAAFCENRKNWQVTESAPRSRPLRWSRRVHARASCDVEIPI